MVIALVRHGQTDWNLERRMQGTSDVPLNPLGREQARAAGIELAGEPWDAVVSSPLIRARETAAIIAEQIGLSLGGSYHELIEQHFGDAEGMKVTEALERWPDWNAPGREEDAAVGPRGLSGLVRIAEEFGDANVIAVAHGTLIRSIVSTVTGHPRDHYPFLENGASSRVHLHSDGWRVLTFGGETIGVEIDVG